MVRQYRSGDSEIQRLIEEKVTNGLGYLEYPKKGDDEYWMNIRLLDLNFVVEYPDEVFYEN
ncbi:hypothetical protein GOV12_07515 [Candidatus Pacearchaeota archaeon]|nr:hypothetical protein [Candidatus Pacearchaeota archaeon]